MRLCPSARRVPRPAGWSARPHQHLFRERPGWQDCQAQMPEVAARPGRLLLEPRDGSGAANRLLRICASILVGDGRTVSSQTAQTLVLESSTLLHGFRKIALPRSLKFACTGATEHLLACVLSR